MEAEHHAPRDYDDRQVCRKGKALHQSIVGIREREIPKIEDRSAPAASLVSMIYLRSSRREVEPHQAYSEDVMLVSWMIPMTEE